MVGICFPEKPIERPIVLEEWFPVVFIADDITAAERDREIGNDPKLVEHKDLKGKFKLGGDGQAVFGPVLQAIDIHCDERLEVGRAVCWRALGSRSRG